MRNLKRALSLTLASVMLLGMMVMGTSAASFPDVDDNDNVEAIGVLAAVGVIVGDNGNYYPDRTVTRNEMAVIMTNLLGLNAKDFSGTCPFNDVPSWAQDYVAACYANGIVAGRSATVYDGQATVTAVEAASMMMRALGYFKYTEDYEGGFTAATVRQAATLRLFDGVAGSATAPMTRNDVAQLALNTLEADVVEFTGTLGFEINGIKQGYVSKYEPQKDLNNVNQNGYNYTGDTTTTHQKEYLQLCEKLYDGKLKKGTAIDNFGRPSTEWTYKDESVKAPKESNVIFTASKSADDVAKALKGYKVNDTSNPAVPQEMSAASFTSASIVSANGAAAVAVSFADPDGVGPKVAPATLAEAIANYTGNGKAVEIYADEQNIITKIVVLSYKVDTVASIVESKDGDYRKTTYNFDTFTVTNLNKNNQTFTDPAKDDTIVIHGSVAEDDVVTILTLVKETHVYPTTRVTGSQSAYNTGDNSITVSGTAYKVGSAVAKDAVVNYVAIGDFLNSDKEYDYYLDQFGYVVKGEAVESTDYAVIDAMRWTQETTALDQDGAVAARLIFADGHTENVVLNKLNDKKFFSKDAGASSFAPEADNGEQKYAVSNDQDNNGVYAGQIVTYTKKDNGKYDLTSKTSTNTASQAGDNNTAAGVASANNVSTLTGANVAGKDINAITKGVPTIGNGITVAGDNNTVYIVKTKDGDDNVFNAYVGYQNVPTVKLLGNSTTQATAKISYVVPAGGGAMDYVFIDATAADAGTTKSGDMVYIMDATKYDVSGTGSDAKYTFTKAAFNGEARNVTVDKDTFDNDITGNGLYEVKTNDKGEVTDATKQTVSTDYKLTTRITASAKDGVVAGYTYKGGETVWVVDGDTIYSGTAESARAKDDIYVKVVDKNGDPDEKVAISVMYVVKPASTATAGVYTSAVVASPSSTDSDTKDMFTVTIGGKGYPVADNKTEVADQAAAWIAAWNADSDNTGWTASGDNTAITITSSSTASGQSAPITGGSFADGDDATSAAKVTGLTLAAAVTTKDATSKFKVSVDGKAYDVAKTNDTVAKQLAAWVAAYNADVGNTDFTAAVHEDGNKVVLTAKTTGSAQGQPAGMTGGTWIVGED